MPSRAKRWFVADETDEAKIFHYENEETPEIWLEIQLDKRTEHYTRIRCTYNTPGKWHRLAEPIRNYQIAKRHAFEYLVKKAFERAETA